MNVPTVTGASPLHIAAEAGHARVVECLLANDAFLTSTTSNNLTPILAAAAAGRAECLHQLLEHHKKKGTAIVDVLSHINTIGQTPLHLAAAAGHYAATEVLLAHIPKPFLPTCLERMDLFGRTALRAALRAASAVKKRARAATATAAASAAAAGVQVASASGDGDDAMAVEEEEEEQDDDDDEPFFGLETAMLLLRHGASAVFDDKTADRAGVPVHDRPPNLLNFALDREQPWSPAQRVRCLCAHARVGLCVCGGWGWGVCGSVGICLGAADFA